MEINIAFASTGYGPIWPPAASSWLRCVAYTARKFAIDHIGKIGGAGVTDRTYTHTAENRLVREMLEAPSNFTHLFLTEADMILPHDAITKLLAVDQDMVSGVYFLRANEQENVGQPCLFKRPWLSKEEKAKEHSDYLLTAVKIFPQDAPFELIGCAGLGCLLVKREVFEKKVSFPWFDLDAVAYGSDFFFSKKCRDAGVELWIEPTVLCGQIDYYEANVEDYKWRLENDPNFARGGYIIGTPGPDPFSKTQP